MPVATADDLLAALRQSSLISTRRLSVWLEEHPPTTFATSAALAHQLVAEGLLTRYQANLLLNGQSGDAFLGGKKYKVLDLLGKGGMGAVYLCEFVRLQALVAVKVLPVSDDDPEAKKRFEREARAFYSLNHPNLVRGHGVETDGARHLIVMDYVDGVDLQALVTRIGPLPVGRAVNYVRQAAVGMAYAHAQGWIHRDIKPANIAVDRVGAVRVLDMGLAKDVYNQTRAITRNDDGYVRGTTDYMAPEQLSPDMAGGAAIDGRCDVYSLGVTLYFLLSGRLPFDATTTAQQMVAILMKPPLSIHTFRPDLPEGLVRAIGRMLEKKPQGRLNSSEVVDALAPWDGGVSAPTEDEIPPRATSVTADHALVEELAATESNTRPLASAVTPPNSVSVTRPPTRRNRLVMVALAVVASALIAVVFVSLWSEPRPDGGGGVEPPLSKSPFRGNYVPVTTRHGPGPNALPFPGGHKEYLGGRTYPTVAEALKDPRVGEGNCRILLLDEIHEEQADVDATGLPGGTVIESARSTTSWTPPENARRDRPLLRISGGAGLTVRNLTLGGNDKLDTPFVWDRPGRGCRLHDLRVNSFSRSGVRVTGPAGEPADPVQLTQVRISRGLVQTAEACIEVTGDGDRPARHLRLTECRLEGPADSWLICAGGIDGLEVSRCRLLGAKSGVRFTGPGPLRATLTSNTLANCTNPIRIDYRPPAPGKDDLLALDSNLFVRATKSAVLWSDQVPPAPELFRGSRDNWCDEGSCEPPTEGVPLKTVPPLSVPTYGDDDKFLRYPVLNPLATAGPDGRPIGYGPVEQPKP